MNRTDLYVRACSTITLPENTLWDTPSLQSVAFLRQSLSCCVCSEALTRAFGPSHTICPHRVCDLCRGGTMKLKPSCSWCKDHGDFVEDTQTNIMVKGFYQLCRYIDKLPFWRRLQSGDFDATDSVIARFIEAVETGLDFPLEDDEIDDTDGINVNDKNDDDSEACGETSHNTKNNSKLLSCKETTLKSHSPRSLVNSKHDSTSMRKIVKLNKSKGKQPKLNRKNKPLVAVPSENCILKRLGCDGSLLTTDDTVRKRTYCRCGTIRGTTKLVCDLTLCPCYSHNFKCNTECKCLVCKNPYGRRQLKQMSKRTA